MPVGANVSKPERSGKCSPKASPKRNPPITSFCADYSLAWLCTTNNASHPKPRYTHTETRRELSHPKAINPVPRTAKLELLPNVIGTAFDELNIEACQGSFVTGNTEISIRPKPFQLGLSQHVLVESPLFCRQAVAEVIGGCFLISC